MSGWEAGPPAWMDDEGEDLAPAAPTALRVVEPDEPAPIPPGAEPSVWWSLERRKRGKGEWAQPYAAPTPLNVDRVLRRDSRWVGRVRYNALANRVEIRDIGDVWEPLRDVIATRTMHWLEEHYALCVPEERVGRELAALGDEARYHPVQAYLGRLSWDGRPRIRGMLAEYFGVEDTELTARISMRWLISAVARAMEPGCKVDTVLVLVGAQGAKKSSTMRVLFGADVFSGTPLNWQSDTALYNQIQGKWGCEIPELSGFGKADWNRIKAIVSSETDRYRQPYARSAEDYPRSCVFVGTTNDDEFLGDPTGSRRFWPVRVGAEVRRWEIGEDRDQLWAEAMSCYRRHLEHVATHPQDQGGSEWQWWLTREEEDALFFASDEYRVRDAWEAPAAAWLIGKDSTTVEEVLTSAIGKPREQQHSGDMKRIGGVLKILGFERERGRRDASGHRPVNWTRR